MPGEFDKKKKAQIKNELEDLLSQYGNDGRTVDDDVINDQLQEIVAAPPIDFEEMNAGFLKRAKEIVDSAFTFYVTLGIMDETDYIKHKKQLDESNIQNIFFQVKTIKFAIEKIMQEINAGSTHPRLFEVMGQLQDKFANAIKTQANYILFLEDSYKKTKNDMETRSNATGQPQIGQGLKPSREEFFVTAGTKNLVKTLDGLPVVEEFRAESGDSLTNPIVKNDLMEDRGLTHLKAKDSDVDNDFSEELDELI